MTTKESGIAKASSNILVFNVGSSSLKYKMTSMPSGKELLGGEVQRIGAKTAEPSMIIHFSGGRKSVYNKKISGYGEALTEVIGIISSEDYPHPDFIAHRYVHGGTQFRSDSIITYDDLHALHETEEFAPVHNPPVIELIRRCMEQYPDIPQGIILDTSFHSTIPEYAGSYPLPKDLTNRFGIRKYGFHGISHQYVVEEAAQFLGIPLERFNAVSCHLGSGGASLCAVVGGNSVDNSMGFSPLQGLVMSTRSGDIDPSIVLKMIVYAGGDHSKVNRLLNKKSGVLGLSGMSSDIRDIINMSVNYDDERAQTTLDVYLWRIKKYLGAYLAAVGRVDAILFTDTIGESVPLVRETVCRNLDFFGVKLDEWRNSHLSGFPYDVSVHGSNVRIVVVKTDEEKGIARRAYELAGLGGGTSIAESDGTRGIPEEEADK